MRENKPSQFCAAASMLGKKFSHVQTKMSKLRQRQYAFLLVKLSLLLDKII